MGTCALCAGHAFLPLAAGRSGRISSVFLEVGDGVLVLVTYDVCLDSGTGQKRLRRVAKCCLNYGMRVQNSVFECVVDQAQFLRLRHEVLGEIDESKDSVRFYRLGSKYAEKIEHYGAKPTMKVEEPLIL